MSNTLTVEAEARALFEKASDLNRRLPEHEDVIMRSPLWASQYARHILKSRWPEAEAVIATDGDAALGYSRIAGRFRLGEPAIMRSSFNAWHYARHVIRGRWPEGEAVVLANPHHAYRYAVEVVQGRWPEAEVVFATSSILSRRYAEELSTLGVSLPHDWQETALGAPALSLVVEMERGGPRP